MSRKPNGRLGHRDAATTLREYAYDLPLSAGRADDAINDHLGHPTLDDEPFDIETQRPS